MGTTGNKQLIAVIKMPTKIGDIIVRLQETESKLTTNIYFLAGWLAGTLNLTQFTADITAFMNAETSVRNRVAGAVGLRNAAYTTIKPICSLYWPWCRARQMQTLPLQKL